MILCKVGKESGTAISWWKQIDTALFGGQLGGLYQNEKVLTFDPEVSLLRLDSTEILTQRERSTHKDVNYHVFVNI